MYNPKYLNTRWPILIYNPKYFLTYFIYEKWFEQRLTRTEGDIWLYHK